ncbi:MAG TPA: MFS transporter [Symbiobacteriaceae bacterium]|nr:MFS transporter [Symbiobacteriaceae bacterium]
MAVFLGETFRPMRHRNYLLYWVGFLVSNAGAWIQSMAQGWLVYELSGSAAWLGAIGFVRAVPLILLSLVGGATADRFPIKRILHVTQTVMMLNAVTLGTLVSLEVVQVWHVIALSAVTAAAQAFDNPARQALVPSLVEKADLHPAISLNAIAFNGAAVFGPSLAGVLVPIVGLAGCFYVNAASYGAVFLALALMHFPAHQPRIKRQSMGRDVLEGLRFIGTSPVILALTSMAALTSLLARPYQQFILVFAKDVLAGQIGLAGIMQASPALGTVIFMLSVASLGNIQYKGKLLVGAGLGFCIAMISFAWSGNIYLSILLLIITGGMNMTWQTTLNTLLQTNTPDAMRGRVMASYTITALGMMPLGQGPMGYTMERLGPQWALTLGAALSGLWIAYMALVRVRKVPQLP